MKIIVAKIFLKTLKNTLVFLSLLLPVLIILSLFSMVFSGCGKGFSSSMKDMGTEEETKKINIIVSIPPQAEFVEKVGKEKVLVTVLVPPGADPHTFELKPEQMKIASDADIYFKLGSGIEFEIVWAEKIIALNKNMEIFDCSLNIELIEYEEDHDKYHDVEEHPGEFPSGHNNHEGDTDNNNHLHSQGNDPHIWLSIRNARIIVNNIYNGLSVFDPENKDFYLKNMQEYEQDLLKMNKSISNTLSKIKNKKLMVYHPAWQYFAADYGFEQIAIESFGKEPTMRELEELIKLAQKNNIKVIFASPQFSTKSADVMARQLGAAVVLIDPLEKNYIENMEKIRNSFSNYFD